MTTTTAAKPPRKPRSNTKCGACYHTFKEHVGDAFACPGAATTFRPRENPKSRQDRWSEAVSDSRDNISTVRDGLERLNELRSEYEEWHGNLPENLQNGTLGEKLQAVIDIDIDSHLTALDELEGVLDECESADLPRGFGND